MKKKINEKPWDWDLCLIFVSKRVVINIYFSSFQLMIMALLWALKLWANLFLAQRCQMELEGLQWGEANQLFSTTINQDVKITRWGEKNYSLWSGFLHNLFRLSFNNFSIHKQGWQMQKMLIVWHFTRALFAIEKNVKMIQFLCSTVSLDAVMVIEFQLWACNLHTVSPTAGWASISYLDGEYIYNYI